MEDTKNVVFDVEQLLFTRLRDGKFKLGKQTLFKFSRHLSLEAFNRDIY